MTVASGTATRRAGGGEGQARAADPVTVEIVRNALVAASDEMSVNLGRSAYTPIIYEMKDYSVALFDAEFRLLGQAPGLPIFLGALEDAVRVTVEHYGAETVAPGDIYLINDAYMVGSHLNDVTLFSPVFAGGWSAMRQRRPTGSTSARRSPASQ